MNGSPLATSSLAGSPTVWRRAGGIALLGGALGVALPSSVACSARSQRFGEGESVLSCATLRDVGVATDAPDGAGHAVWLIGERGATAGAVVNWEQARIGGRDATRVEYDGRTWLVGASEALSADWVGAGEIGGQRLECDPARLSDYRAVALAPTHMQAHGLTELSRFDGASSEWSLGITYDLALQRPDLLVVARGDDGLRWVAVSPERDQLREVGRLRALLGDMYNDVVAIDERYVAVASAARGLVIVDARDPTQPREVADGLPTIHPMDGHGVTVANGRLYLAQAPAAGTGAVVAFDVSQPDAPRELWRWKADPGQDAHDVTVLGERVFVSSLRGGITLLEVTGDAMPHVVARRHGLAAHSCSPLDDGQRVLWGEESIGGTLHLFEVQTNAAGETTLQGLRLPSSERIETDAGSATVTYAASPHHSACHGGLCFVAHYQLGLRVIDLSGLGTAAAGTETAGAVAAATIAQYPTWRMSPAREESWLRGAVGVTLELPWVYVADSNDGIVVLSYEASAHHPEPDYTQ